MLLLAACVGTQVDTGETSVVEVPPSGLLPEHNYQYTASLDLGVFSSAPSDGVEFDWSKLDRDIAGRPVDPYEMAQVALVWLPGLEAADIASRLAYGRIFQEDIGALFAGAPGGRSQIRLGELLPVDGTIPIKDLFVTGSGHWLLVLLPRATLGYAALALIEPDVASTNILHTLDGGTSHFTLDASLGEPYQAEGAGVSWRELTLAASGYPFADTPPDILWIGRYALTPDEIEAQFVNAETLAEESWVLPISGQDEVEDLSDAVDKNGVSFPGFDDAFTWALALRCTRCLAAAPPFATLVEPAP